MPPQPPKSRKDMRRHREQKRRRRYITIIAALVVIVLIGVGGFFGVRAETLEGRERSEFSKPNRGLHGPRR